MSDQVARLNTALEGRYAIERELGEGGMATVYLADDLKHNRKVALKVLKPDLAAVVGAERFVAEIETTANLTHPHILPLHDSGEADGFLFYVMPYLVGETLADRIGREQQLPVDEAVALASKVAGALQHAHEHGVIHRDIKPANILLQDGEPVVADFGIALALGVAGGTRLTETGLSVGTPYYMSPEQATGDLAVAASTDTYALGAVLYEMLVGEPPYPGATAQAVLGKIIAGKPVSATEHRPSIPANVDAAVRKALEKLPADRFASAQDFVRALGDEHFRYGELAASAEGAPVGPWRRLSVAGWSVAAAATIVAGWALLRPAPAPPGMVRFAITPTENAPLHVGGNAHDLAISRDGSLVVYQTGTQPADYQLAIRPLDQLESAPLRGTEGAVAPFFSHNGEWVGFLEANGDVLKKVSVFGGPPITLLEAPSVFGPTWGADDWIIFGSNAGLFRVAGGGGEAEALTTLDSDRGEGAHAAPHEVDGRGLVMFVIFVTGDPEIAVLDLDGGQVTRLGIPGLNPRYVSTGHIVYASLDGSIRAVGFDIDALEVTDSPVPLVEGIGTKFNGTANFDVSDDGRLVYALGGNIGGGAPPTNLVLVELDGTRSVLAELDDRAITPRFSPDGLRIAYASTTTLGGGPEADLWVLGLARGEQTRTTFGGNNRYYPIWTRDGTRLIHADGSGNQNRLLSTAADGGGSDTLLALGDRRFPTSWSPDGRILAHYLGPQGTPTNSRDLWMLSVDGDILTPEPFVETPFMERGAIFSPDGRWVAYVSDKSGQNDVYARPFPGPGVEITISVQGGQEPVWAPSGSALYYRNGDELLVVSVEETGSSLSVGTPRHVLDDRFMRDTGGSAGGVANYDIAPNGEAFVMVEDVSTAGEAVVASPKLYVVTNWFEELRQRLGN